MKMTERIIENKIFGEIDYSENYLNKGEYDNCDLNRAVFGNTVLEKADFRTSYNYALDPEIYRINKAKFSIFGIIGLLGKYNIVAE